MKKWIKFTSSILLGVTLIGSFATPVKADTKSEIAQAEKIERENRATQARIKILDQKIAALKKQLGIATGKHVVESASRSKLASLNYSGQDVVMVNKNKPSFSASQMSLSRGAWQKYGELDYLNRVTPANAMLNKRLMPSARRENLYINPTGWHNKRIASGWLYNRCHLIGYQLTGQNNNIRNLMTGTRQLNDPGMLRYENEVAAYLRSSSKHYVRYRVSPIFKGNELLARGVQMEAWSVGSNAIKFNVYIFNVQDGVKLNYQTGTSRVY